MDSFARRLQVPAGCIVGRGSDVVKRAGLAQTRRSMRVTQIDGGHLFPFEVPWDAAQAIRTMARMLTGL
jgi:hypothetical protein